MRRKQNNLQQTNADVNISRVNDSNEHDSNK